MAVGSNFVFKIEGQTAADRDMIIIDSLQEFVIALSKGTLPTPYDVLFSYNTARLAWQST